ncbi:unnamed protein product [Spirodela intermedia]|uniref:Uncharacterized protein n=1 Tax=Spirodela intermedia TaxID=51605 RepID=A0A7I8IG16_SPIIN|nr:unnamed protein product [Spirodela intermedia]CAA6656809.1 unnamed protein product [Spirodela intermedia]
MKLEDFLMQRQEEHRRRCELEEEVAELHGVLEKEQKLNGVLQCALHGPLVSRSSVSSMLPLQVQVLLAELAMVEEEIAYLEGKVKELRLCLYEEGRQTEELKLHHQERWLRRRRGRFFRRFKLQTILWRSQTMVNSDEETCEKTSNELSEELIRCLISIFHKLNQTSGRACLDQQKLIHQLRTVDLTFLNYKQKLAFWINIYNACIMNAFLQHELPSSSDKVLELLNKAALNVGGVVLNALAIEHFILRHPSRSKLGVADGKERLLQHSYGLSYPEPNITFALCRGTWSSPALRVYTADNVVDELERAKTEYLEASVHITSKRRILLPKLLYWHMKDFADDVDSLVEWVYSQLPRSGPLKKSMMECLKGDRKQGVGKLVEILSYEPSSDTSYPFWISPGSISVHSQTHTDVNG